MTPTPAHRPTLTVSAASYMRARLEPEPRRSVGLLRLDRERAEIAARTHGGRVVAVVSDAGLTGFAVVARRASASCAPSR